jgi:outer membrane murein-binding lipoprotein Lpp
MFCTLLMWCALDHAQRNIDKITSNLAELEAKLKHEQEKFAAYNTDLQKAEQRCAPAHQSLSLLVACSSCVHSWLLMHASCMQAWVGSKAKLLGWPHAL